MKRYKPMITQYQETIQVVMKEDEEEGEWYSRRKVDKKIEQFREREMLWVKFKDKLLEMIKELEERIEELENIQMETHD